MNKKRDEDRYADRYLVCLTKGQKYVFEASDCVMSIEELLSKIVPFDECRPSWWTEAYKKGRNDAFHEMLNVLENITINRRENKNGL